ncbi:hypothetical protein [Paraburkholderia antibiotica]|nr:hypothetical protein [Paraburkholderia antibiotica]
MRIVVGVAGGSRSLREQSDAQIVSLMQVPKLAAKLSLRISHV